MKLLSAGGGGGPSELLVASKAQEGDNAGAGVGSTGAGGAGGRRRQRRLAPSMADEVQQPSSGAGDGARSIDELRLDVSVRRAADDATDVARQQAAVDEKAGSEARRDLEAQQQLLLELRRAGQEEVERLRHELDAERALRAAEEKARREAADEAAADAKAKLEADEAATAAATAAAAAVHASVNIPPAVRVLGHQPANYLAASSFAHMLRQQRLTRGVAEAADANAALHHAQVVIGHLHLSPSVAVTMASQEAAAAALASVTELSSSWVGANPAEVGASDLRAPPSYSLRRACPTALPAQSQMGTSLSHQSIGSAVAAETTGFELPPAGALLPPLPEPSSTPRRACVSAASSGLTSSAALLAGAVAPGRMPQAPPTMSGGRSPPPSQWVWVPSRPLALDGDGGRAANDIGAARPWYQPGCGGGAGWVGYVH